MNSFKKLYDHKLSTAEDFADGKKRVKKNLDRNIEFISFAGDMLELYVPKVLDYVVSSFEEQSQNKPKSDKNR